MSLERAVVELLGLLVYHGRVGAGRLMGVEVPEWAGDGRGELATVEVVLHVVPPPPLSFEDSRRRGPRKGTFCAAVEALKSVPRTPVLNFWGRGTCSSSISATLRGVAVPERREAVSP